MIAQALRWEKNAAESEAQSGARAKALRAQQAERKKVGGLILQTETELKGHAQAIDVWHARLFLPPESAAETVKARLEELDALARLSTQMADARQAKATHQTVVDDIETRAARLATLVGEQVPVSVDDFAGDHV